LAQSLQLLVIVFIPYVAALLSGSHVDPSAMLSSFLRLFCNRSEALFSSDTSGMTNSNPPQEKERGKLMKNTSATLIISIILVSAYAGEYDKEATEAPSKPNEHYVATAHIDGNASAV
jgi:hypothetical protein